MSVDEKSAKPPTTTSTSASTPKPRSCVVCRSRKVRCDKLAPCSNCRRAGIACVLPSTDRPPRWARRLDRAAHNAAANAQSGSQDPKPAAAQAVVMERLRNLEGLVKELTSQLEQANAASSSVGGGSSGFNSQSPESLNQEHDVEKQGDSPLSGTGSLQKPFGRLVLHDANRSRYVSSGFWSRVNDELDGLKIDSLGFDSDTSDEDTPENSPPTQDTTQGPSDRYTFLFRHNLSLKDDLRRFHPLPSQIPFLLDVFSENVNMILRVVHMPTVAKMVRDMRGSDTTQLIPSNEALLFSIYYAAVVSMEEEDVLTNFGVEKTELSLKYRVGLEHALAKADFLNLPDLVLVQALTIFLSLVRRYDSSRFVWMMTGMAIKMAQALGLQRDGAKFEHLTPYEVEIRRRVWWSLCLLDIRSAEDQGMEYTISRGSFDTQLPLNINDADIEPGRTQTLIPREGLTDATICVVMLEICEITRKMMAQSFQEGAPGIEEQSHLVSEMYEKLDRGYLQHSAEPNNIAYWVTVICTRLTMAKMTLFIYAPVLFSSPSKQFSEQIRTKLLVAAIEAAEYNHALNSEDAARNWRWIYQTYTHWHAIVYLFIEISRRPWSPLIERAWVALHSKWLIPSQSHMDKTSRMWLPLRRLTAKAQRHREAELERLRRDSHAARALEIQDQQLPVPASQGSLPNGSEVVKVFRERWRQLVGMPEKSEQNDSFAISKHESDDSWQHPFNAATIGKPATSMYSNTAKFEPHQDSPSAEYNANKIYQTPYSIQNDLIGQPSNIFDPTIQTQTTQLPYQYNSNAHLDSTIPAMSTTDPGLVPWLWGNDMFANMDVDIGLGGAVDVSQGMDLDSEVDWYNWVESAKGMEFHT